MRFNAGNEVVIIGDLLNYGLPINQAAIVMRIDLNSLDCRNYLLRIPKTQKEYWVTENDIEFASVVNTKQADTAMKEYMINVSLQTKNKTLFEKASQPNIEW